MSRTLIALLLASCATSSSSSSSPFDCESDKAKQDVLPAQSQLLVELASRGNTNRKLNSLLAESGPIVVCAGELALEQLEHGEAGARPQDDVARYSKLSSWVAAHSHLVK